MYDELLKLVTDSQTEDEAKETDDANFLSEIVEITSDSPPNRSKSPNVFQWPEFMEMRCQSAKSSLKEALLHEAKHRTYGFIAAVPLYPYDFRKVEKQSRLKRPDICDVKPVHFREFVDYVNDLGFSCFIGQPGLTSSCKDGQNIVTLLNFGICDYSYFGEISLPQTRRAAQDSGKIQWTLYVLLPDQQIPEFLIRQKSSSDVTSSRSNTALLVLLKLTLTLFTIVGIATPLILTSGIFFDSGKASDALLNEVPE